MVLSWRMRRQLLYYAVGGVVALILFLLVSTLLLSQTPTCSDGSRNGTETGVDCGGSCANICMEQAEKPRVLWTRAFRTGANTYTLAAYIESPYPTATASRVPYFFELRDDKGLLVLERKGLLDIPPIPIIPIVEVNVNVGERSVSHTFLSFPQTPQWVKVSSNTKRDVRISLPTPNSDYSRVSATLTNSSLQDAEDVTVMAVLFDTAGVARGASKTFVSELPRTSSKSIVFTWPSGVPNIVRVELTVLPSI